MATHKSKSFWSTDVMSTSKAWGKVHFINILQNIQLSEETSKNA